ncbi:hypothetical protein HanXRQr2_Chr12g0544701 [Helianthus annuus]|uniref:Uncharacterized protein n=1 Tax=Helianthus annuus TaxID=4232 RepID=A0A9K3HH14_HELAN|nr:hypothetical protein HanXRQr2_Chr12g0544701 [Helianthus annuus]KAJ0862961.1 hypothetical protein HanPSC8_Chr12g0524361 [Helianthus annuus]
MCVYGIPKQHLILGSKGCLKNVILMTFSTKREFGCQQVKNLCAAWWW